MFISRVQGFRSSLQTIKRGSRYISVKSSNDKPYNSSQKGCSKGALSVKGVSSIKSNIDYCYQHNLSVIPQGGNTNLVESATPVQHSSPLYLMGQDSSDLSVDVKNKVITADAGATILDIQQKAQDYNLRFDLDFGSKGTATIGGALATNAGGMRNRISDLVVSMAGVTGNQDYLQQNITERPTIKNSVLPDKQYSWLGSQGYFGFIHHCQLLLKEPSQQEITLLLGFGSLSDSLRWLGRIRQPSLSLAELISKQALSAAELRPFSKGYDYYLLCQFQQSQLESTWTDQLLESVMFWIAKHNLDADVIITQSDVQTQQLLAARESISDQLRSLARSNGQSLLGLDLQIPNHNLHLFMTKASQLATDFWGARPFPFGHCAQHPHYTTVHFNCLIEDSNKEFDRFYIQKDPLLTSFVNQADSAKTLSQFLVWFSHYLNGAHSSEHGGLGSRHLDHTVRYSNKELLDHFVAQKMLHDPNHIFQRDRWNQFLDLYQRRFDSY
ncbi:hypothetical protein DID75_03075 [Candidatus Marinamargulisbacteria bacterium SCGC AG-410-N11]|nr:hypothetical protein DID75_03075 [Candidatus Marinamargulisbacteria bacterium SCGC AG-410-N11]